MKVKEGAPTVALMFGIGMLINAMTGTDNPGCNSAVMQMITPTTAIGLILFVCILSPEAFIEDRLIFLVWVPDLLSA